MGFLLQSAMKNKTIPLSAQYEWTRNNPFDFGGRLSLVYWQKNVLPVFQKEEQPMQQRLRLLPNGGGKVILSL